jgi:hypothetical protein
MRLWRKSTNLDRRNLEILAQLAQTKAQPQLVEMYSNMKKEDPGSTIPDLAYDSCSRQTDQKVKLNSNKRHIYRELNQKNH